MDCYSLKSVSDLPIPFRSIFSFRYFNSLQSECFPVCFHSDMNMVISAPTGSGKTVLFELCILRLLSRFVSEGKFVHSKGTLKTVYIAPSKALVQEKLRGWSQKFGSLGIDCLELTGDNEFYNRRSIQEADIILTTPEKFDAVTRYRINDGGLSFFGDIALLLIDEVHLLNDPRGAALEAIVSRIKILSQNPEMSSCPLSSVRILAVSATIPNIEDLAEWLNVPAQGIKRFGEEMRPVKLTTKVFGYAAAKNDFLFEKRLQNYIFDLLMQYSSGKSALVFCSTRKGAQEAALRLSQTAMTLGYSNPFIKDNEQQERLREASLSCSDKQMQSCILFGVGFHNGGMCLKDRNLVEGLFLKGDIQVICTTNTLAHGINLPAHTVVIKSTQHLYSSNKEKGRYTEYDRSIILQMCGRAGRPPFDDTGMVIIMTRRETVHLYENLLNGCEMVESQLLSCVTEHLTAEIVQLTVSDIPRAIEWMKCSYLYVRIKKNPGNYGISKHIARGHIEKKMQEISVQKVNELSQYQMIWTDGDGFLLKPLEPGRLMTKYYLKFDTMKHIMQIPESCSMEDVLNVICRAAEISWIQLRRNEKKILNDINADKDARLHFHINGDKGKRKKRIQTREEKIFILANDCLTGDPSVHDLSLNQDMNSICSNGSRIAKCMKDYFIFKKNYRGAVNATLLAKSLHQKLWDDSPYLLKQLPGIGMVTAKALQSMGIKSFDELSEADPRRIEIVTGRKFPFGNHIKESLLSLPPKVDISIEESDSYKPGKSKLVVILTRISETTQSARRHYADIIVGSEEDNLIHFHEKIRVDDFSSPYSVTVLAPIPQQGQLTVKADFFFEEYIGLDVHRKLLLTTKANSMKCGDKKPTPCLPPDRICVLEDDTEKSNISAEKLSRLAEATTEDPLMPSFKLIDEDFGQDERATGLEKDKCRKIMSEQTIFDHIREKAKNFPVVNTSTSAYSLEGHLMPRKRTREKMFGLDAELIVLEENDGDRLPWQILQNSSSAPIELKEEGHSINNYQNIEHQTSIGGSSPINFWDDAGGFSSASENIVINNLDEEAVYGHTLKKAEKLPSLPRTTKLKSLIKTSDRSSWNQGEFWAASSSISKESRSEDIPRDTSVLSTLESAVEVTNASNSRAGLEHISDFFPPNPCGTYGSSSVPPKTPRIDLSTSPIKMLSFDISMMKGNAQLAESGSFHTEKQQPSTGEPRRQCCSLAMASESKEVDSFLGFKSVFSFL